VANAVVYVGSYDDKLYAFDAATGHLIWSTATNDKIYSSPAVANGVVYVGSEDRKLYAFTASAGQLIWSASTGGLIDSSPAVADGVVYVGSYHDALYAFGLPPALAPEPPARPDPATLQPSFALVPQRP
jgi:outer membrane protein assembly factor BamB